MLCKRWFKALRRENWRSQGPHALMRLTMTPPGELGYTRETGTIWQIGVLTAERSTFWPQKMRF